MLECFSCYVKAESTQFPNHYVIQITKDWVDYTAALGPLLVSLLVAGIAFYNWKVDSNRLKHERFDRRYDYYAKTRDFLRYIINVGHPEDALVFEYRDSTQGIQFVFDHKIEELRSRIVNAGFQRCSAAAELNGALSAKRRTELAELDRQLKTELDAEFSNLDKAFKKHLKL